MLSTLQIMLGRNSVDLAKHERDDLHNGYGVPTSISRGSRLWELELISYLRPIYMWV